jgi:hypothetical protein
MNEHLPPIDAEFRGQLERRAAGRLPAGLLAEIDAGLDSVAKSQPRVLVSFVRPAPRAAGALLRFAAVVALLAALVAVPALRNGPAASGYPIDRALTTAELAAVMSGPALATNTALVAEVTIHAKTDVCPMDRYPTVGVVDGIPSQVCVMGSGVGAYMNVSSQSGVYAFRYLAPGVLGLVGEVTPASSRLAFRVADEWPLGGSTFVVDGWLGSQGLVTPCPSMAPGDILTPNGNDCPGGNWLSDEPTAPQLTGQEPIGNGTRALDLYGTARYVEADAARQFDSIDGAGAVRGVYVVRSSTGACPDEPVYSSKGCAHWLVLAKLANITVPSPTPGPTATPRPQAPTGYPIDRALTTSELGRLLDAGWLKLYDTVVVDAQVTLEASGTCQAPATSSGEFAGFIVGIDPQVCVYQRSGSSIVPGQLVLRVLGDRTLGYMGTITGASGQLAHAATDSSPDGLFLVHGWLDTANWTCGKPENLPGFGGPDPLFPVYDTMCHAALTNTRFMPPAALSDMTPLPFGPPRIQYFGIPNDGKSVDAGPYFTVPATSPTLGSTQGTYLLFKQPHYSSYGTWDPEDYYVLARLTDVVLPPPTASPTPVPTPTPTPQPPATPVTPTLSGYPTERALTPAELGGFLGTDGVKDKVVVAEVSISKGDCPPLGGYLPIGTVAGLDSVCVVGIGDGKSEHQPAAASGVFAFRVLDAHTLGFMANVSSAPTGFAFSGHASWPAGKTILVSGWLVGSSGVYFCPIEGEILPEPLDPGGTSCGPTWLAAEQVTGPLSSPPATDDSGFHQIAIPDYPVRGGSLLGQNGAAAYGTYLVRDEKQCSWSFPSPEPGVDNTWDKLCGWQIMARVDQVTLPQAIPIPSSSPTPVASSSSGLASTGLWGAGNRPLTASELTSLWSAGELGGRVVVTKGPVPTCLGVIYDGSPCSPLIAGEGYWVVQFDSAGKPSVLGQLSSTGSTFVWSVDGVKAASSLKPGDIVAVDGLLEYWLNFCDIQRVGGCSQSWLVRPDDNIRSSIEVAEGDYASFASTSSARTAKVRGIYLVRVGEGNSPWMTLARLETAGSTNP